MNNFILGSDPLLYSQIVPSRQQPDNNLEIKRQLDAAVAQYQTIQQQYSEQPPYDHLGELDNLIKSVPEDLINILSADAEFVQLNATVQQMIQEEIMKSVKWKINSNHEAIKKIERLKEIVSNANKAKESEDKKNMLELNDYIKNYSDLTFNEYKQLKQNK